MRAVIASTLPAPKKQVWALLQQTSTLFYVTGNKVFADTSSFTKQWKRGDRIKTTVPMLGRRVPYEIYVARANTRHHIILTQEQGGIVKAWNHMMHVAPIDGRSCSYTDVVDVQGRWFLETFLLWLYVHAYYRKRHKRWFRLLQEVK